MRESIPHIGYGNKATVDPDYFMKKWEQFIATASIEQLKREYEQCKMHGGANHPKANMCWLHDRLLYEIAIPGIYKKPKKGARIMNMLIALVKLMERIR